MRYFMYVCYVTNFQFWFPLICLLQPYLKPGEGPIVLVVAPTRELAVQIKEECDKFGKSSDIKNTVVYGGVPKSKQIRDLQSGTEIVIGECFIFLLKSNPRPIFRWLLLTQNIVISSQQRLED